MATPWTLAYMDVLHRAQTFANAWLEYRGNKLFTGVLARERRLLEIALAIYRVERSRAYGHNGL